MRSWKAQGVELPFGDRERTWWVRESGEVLDRPIEDAETLPGRYVLAGLVDAHSHPAVGVDQTGGPVALDEAQTRANLLAWAETGITLIRDVGSPGGLTLDLVPGPREPSVHAAGRFLAPQHRYFEELLVEPVGDEDLIDVALQQIRAGATWVKVIGDFPRVPEFVDVERTYPLELVTQLCTAVHTAGARVAVHTTLPDVNALVRAGVDSVEHGHGLDESTIQEMARRGTAWTPTLCALLAGTDDEAAPPERRDRALKTRARLAELLPLAVRLGVPVLTGTDVVGSISEEVTHLVDLGLEPSQALAAASVWAREFLGETDARADVVTYEHDPREDPGQLTNPSAVVVGGIRLR